ncbi:MAG TPA: ABC transporter ATP-binding protein [Bryobacteraceae bacterium]
MSFAIRCLELSKQFRRVQALERLDLDVPEGAVYALIGANGAGKTTAIRTMMNIYEPDAGLVEIAGKDSRQLRGRDFRQIGYVSENQKMPEWMTVDYLMRYLKPFYPAWDDAMASDLLRRFGLPGDRKISQLSRGMRMKTALASSLAYHPPLVILDEPFTGLDPLVRDEFIEGLIENAEGTTILISSHDMAEIESFASHAGYLENGKMQFSEEMASLSARFREVEVTLGAPSEVPRNWPVDWLRPETTPAVVRFVDTHFDEETIGERVRKMFPRMTDLSARAMPLREIFVTLAREQRRAA